MSKKIISLLLCIVLAFTCCVMAGGASSSDDTLTRLRYIADKFPHGKYWNHMGSGKNNPDGVTNQPCSSHSNCHWAENACSCNSFDNAIQCMGYAHKIASEITGVSPRNNFTKSYTLDASKLRVGDIIRYRWDQHSLCVTGVSGNRISFTDCNWIGKCQIRWGEMNISDIQGFSYVLHLEGNNRKNTDLDFYHDVSYSEADEPVSENMPSETWTINGGNLNIRENRTTAAGVVGRVFDGDMFRVYRKYDDGEYLWGKVIHDGTVGWCALNFADYRSGNIVTPAFTSLKSSYNAKTSITVKWKPIEGAEKYYLRLLNSQGEIVKKYTVTTEQKSFILEDPGVYIARVYAANSKTPSWKPMVEGKFTLKPYVAVSSLQLNKTVVKLTTGSTYQLKASVSPAAATDKTLKWTSSNTAVATVSAGGKITAKGIGTAKITCTSSSNPSVKVVCTVSVYPKQVSGIKQTYSSAEEVKISWSKAAGAQYYTVYIYDGTGNAYQKAATVKTNSYTIKTKAAKKYKIKIYSGAKDAAGTTYTGKVSETFTAVAGPAKPALKGQSLAGGVKLSWNKVSGATGYSIYEIRSGKAVKLADVSADKLSYTIKGLKKGSVHSYRVRAVRTVGTVTGYGAYSATVKVKVS
ncbi:MAG: Ig-like domain-containing protein [Oscillospiraceae bacterium]|nr:Ig-like domain-containing protein [Oscillospiraceae bacterium]